MSLCGVGDGPPVTESIFDEPLAVASAMESENCAIDNETFKAHRSHPCAWEGA